MQLTTIDTSRSGGSTGQQAVIVADKRLARYYGPGGDRFRCYYHARIARTSDGQLWLNHPTTPDYPEEVSFSDDDWCRAEMYPKCVVGLPDLIAAAVAGD